MYVYSGIYIFIVSSNSKSNKRFREKKKEKKINRPSSAITFCETSMYQYNFALLNKV